MRLARAARLALFVACFVSPPPKADGAVDLYDQYTGPFDHTPPNARDAQALRTVRAALVDTADVLGAPRVLHADPVPDLRPSLPPRGAGGRGPR